MNSIRLAWLAFAILLTGACIALGILQGWVATGILAAAAILPDVALIGAFAGAGRLRPERVRFYNTLHTPLPAIGLVLAGAGLAIGTGSRIALLIGVAWLAHIAIDRACGFGLRKPDGSIRPVGRPRRVYA